jgi:hypothetical protein
MVGSKPLHREHSRPENRAWHSLQRQPPSLDLKVELGTKLSEIVAEKRLKKE